MTSLWSPRWAILAAASAATSLLASDRTDESPRLTIDPARSVCEALSGKTFDGGFVSRAGWVADAAGLPEHCAVAGRIAGSDINFAVRLPSRWNGKARMGATGGWQGAIAGPAMAALSKGYVDYATDSGHAGSHPNGLPYSPAFDVSWANNPEALTNFASLSYQRVTDAARAIIRERYGKEPDRIYFEGCSGGGRVALVLAQRFPRLFDGIIAGAPAPNFIGVFLGWQRAAKALAVPGAAFSPGKLATLSHAVLQACDGNDGVLDGIVSNPLSCSYDPESLRCTGVDSDACLTNAQMNFVKEVTTDTVFPDGSLLVKGLRLQGHEDHSDNWTLWSAPLPLPGNPSLFKEGTASMIKVLIRNPNADPLTYSISNDASNIKNLGYLIDAWPGNLSEFGAAGRKLIIWNGTEDTPVPFENQIEYYKSAVASLGGLDNARNTVKLYLLPGVNHCGGGAGADTFDYLQALDEWVTNNTTPDGKKIVKVVEGVKSLTRPLCPYPTYPRYNGRGDVNDASSFTCTAGLTR